MIYFFAIPIITILILSFLFKINLKNLSFSKVIITVITSIGVGIVYYNIGYPNLSEKDLSKIKGDNLNNIELQKLSILKIKEKIIVLENELFKKPNDIGLLLLLASNYAILQNVEKEIFTLRKILKTKNSPSIQSLLAQAMLRQNEGIINLKIKNLVLQVLKKIPKDEGANYILGLYYKQIGNYSKAKKIWTNTLIHIDENNPWASIIKEELDQIKN